MPTPLQRYQAESARPDFQPDPDQLAALRCLERLHAELLAAASSVGGLRGRWRRLFAPKPAAPKGLYLWGGVGRGKTFLVDVFHASLPPGFGRRIHFHSFMREVHAGLRSLRGHQDPLALIAARWASDLRVLCLDEFHVIDITDAMLLAQLLSALFNEGIALVTTSNEAPDELYRGGLQRERFLPAISLIQSKMEVFALNGSVDYRWRTLTSAATYYSPAGKQADAALARRFEALTHVAAGAATMITIEGREIPARAVHEGVVWFDFGPLCESPRSTADYIEIACCYHSVLISGVPVLTEEQNDAARRFINLVDEFYDRGVNLLLAADAAPEALYAGHRLGGAFRRTASRLVEMQTEEYLAKPHFPQREKLIYQ